MTEQSETIIWEGSVDKGRFFVKVVAIENNLTRGTLQIFDSSGVMKYQREVNAVLSSNVEANSRNVKEWTDIILDWIDNKS
jgi:hypothetical protein